MEGGKVVSALYTHGREECIYMIVEAYRNSAGSHFFCLEKGERKQEERSPMGSAREEEAKLLLLQRTATSQL